MKTAALLFFAVALAGCAEMRWDKPGADAAQASLDLSACRKLAQERVNRLYGPPTPSGLEPRFGNDVSRASGAERQMAQGQAVSVCMRERGYKLSP